VLAEAYWEEDPASTGAASTVFRCANNAATIDMAKAAVKTQAAFVTVAMAKAAVWTQAGRGTVRIVTT